MVFFFFLGKEITGFQENRDVDLTADLLPPAGAIKFMRCLLSPACSEEDKS